MKDDTPGKSWVRGPPLDTTSTGFMLFYALLGQQRDAMGGYDYDIGVIGGGAAGLTLASGSAQLGAKTLFVE